MDFAVALADRGRIQRIQIIAVLAITQLIGWGTASDMLGVLGRVIAKDLKFANEIAFLGAGLALIVSALMGPLVGKWLKRFGAVPVLAAGSISLAAGLALVGSANGAKTYLLAWSVMGIGAALGLSAAAYTAIVEREGGGSKQVIGSLMILTGLSSAIFWPIVSEFNDILGWRLTCFMMAALHVVICLPLHLLALPGRTERVARAQAAVDRGPLNLFPAQRRSAFILIALTTTLFSFMGLGVSATFLALLHQAGTTPGLALQLGSLRGILAISARLVDMLLGKRSTPVTTAIAACGLMIMSTVVLLTLGGSVAAIIVFVVLNGFGAGIASLARVLLPLSFFAVSDYGRQASRLSLPQNLANAGAPAIFTALLDHGSVNIVLMVIILLATMALASAVSLARIERRGTTQLGQPLTISTLSG